MKTIEEIKLQAELPVLVTDEQGLIIYANEPFRAVFGWDDDEVLGHTLEVIIPRSFHDSHHLGFSRFAMTEQSKVLNHPLKLKAVKKDGTEIEAEHFITAEKLAGNWFFAAILRPLDA
ncbi:PAS domain-containing protein [Trichocoleus desertorum AS-A10]|uniref:PAS domain-containing protein n=1 Tax=Trichocoleus desertorum TaxID=1481672 RepID=UPI00329766D4